MQAGISEIARGKTQGVEAQLAKAQQYLNEGRSTMKTAAGLAATLNEKYGRAAIDP